MKCNPWRWLWGLIPILMLGWIAVLGERARIEADLSGRAKSVLERSGYGWANVAFEGRDAILTGNAVEEGEPVKAVAGLLDTMGVRVVTDQSALVEKADKYVWSATRRSNRIRLDGLVPTDKVRRDLAGMVKASFPSLEFEDRMKLARGAPKLDVWLGGVAFGLKQLSDLREGRVDLEQMSLAVSGDALDARSYRSIKSALAGRLPSGVSLKNESVRPPMAAPYVWSARRQGQEILLVGHVPNDTVRDELLRAARRSSQQAKVVDNMEPASGAPENFTGVASALVAQLGTLDEGNAQIKDRAATLSGLAETAELAEKVKGAMASGVLASFKTLGEIRHREPLIKTITPYLTEARVDPSSVVLTGYVPDEASRLAVVAMAKQRFARRQVRDELQLGAGQPPGWERCVETGFDALQRLNGGAASVNGRRLLVTGTTDDEPLAQSMPGDVRARVGSSCDAEVRLELNLAALRVRDEEKKRAEEAARLKIEEEQRRLLDERQAADRLARAEEDRRRADAAARQLAAEAERRRSQEAASRPVVAPSRQVQQTVDFCQEVLSKIVREGSINFKRASFDLEPSSYPTLNKLAAAANQCPTLMVEIGGHTDAEGTPERNQRLSDRQANSVREYLARAGVESGRLLAVGYGQDRNIAPNDTAENRAKNRRIEFVVKIR